MQKVFFVAVATILMGSAAYAQGKGRNTNGVPPGQRPSPGMCRVWINGVPPGQQSAETDCATARAKAAATPNSRVIYGENTSRTASNTNWCNGWAVVNTTSVNGVLGAIINTGTCSDDVWYGKDTNGDGIADVYKRRHINANGTAVLERGRRDSSGNIIVNSRTHSGKAKGKYKNKHKD